MAELTTEKDPYLADFDAFQRSLPADDPAALPRLRDAAVERFAELGFPTPRNEDWKFTPLAPLTRVSFRLAPPGGPAAGLALPDGVRLVFVNGRFAPEQSVTSPLPAGVTVMSLAEALRRHPKQVEPHLARHADYDNHTFTALNTAFLQDGAFVSVPRGRAVEAPIYLVYASSAPDGPAVSHPRTLVVAGEGAQVTLLEQYVGPEGQVYFTNAVTEVDAGPGAVVDHYKLQEEGRQAFHVALTQVYQERGSNFTTHFIGLGGGLVRNEVRTELDGEGCEATINGLYLAHGQQHMDNLTVIDHARPHCASHELYKGILGGRAKGVFNGKIFVRQDAQKTDAKQTNQTLLLSEDATVNTKPQLEIYADDVKCTHGATVGQLDEQQLFYLRSRGLDRDAARSLLIFAFANDIVRRVRVEPLRDRLEELLVSGRGLEGETTV